MRIKTGDTVLVIAGKEKGKTGRVERKISDKDRVVVEGVNFVTRHMKARPGVSQSGRIQKEASVHASNVVLICNKCNEPTRPKTTFLDTGARVRSCTKCQEVIDDAR
jgi:large subunit ribosomal protein L24